MTPATRDPEFDNWPVENREDNDVSYVGTTGGAESDVNPDAGVGVGTAVFYDPEADALFAGEVDEDARQIVPDSDGERAVEPGETLGEAIERLGEETGWDALSTFAEEHLESESDE